MKRIALINTTTAAAAVPFMNVVFATFIKIYGPLFLEVLKVNEN
jgi:hypothetical protein